MPNPAFTAALEARRKELAAAAGTGPTGEGVQKPTIKPLAPARAAAPVSAPVAPSKISATVPKGGATTPQRLMQDFEQEQVQATQAKQEQAKARFTPPTEQAQEMEADLDRFGIDRNDQMAIQDYMLWRQSRPGWREQTVSSGPPTATFETRVPTREPKDIEEIRAELRRQARTPAEPEPSDMRKMVQDAVSNYFKKPESYRYDPSAKYDQYGKKIEE